MVVDRPFFNGFWKKNFSRKLCEISDQLMKLDFGFGVKKFALFEATFAKIKVNKER